MGEIAGIEGAVELIGDGASIGVGGFILARKPLVLLDAICAAGRRDLRMWALGATLDAEVLSARGVLAETRSGYVGFEQLGRAPAWSAAVEAGTVAAYEYSELLFTSGLRASIAGLPFLPTRGALRSELAGALGLAEIACPYSGEPLLAVPAMRPDVAIVHALAADEHGAVLGPEDPDFLFDLDANVARAARSVVVSVERIVPTAEVRAARRRTLLFPHEVDLVVPLPGGAGASAMPGAYRADLPAIRRYLADPSPQSLAALVAPRAARAAEARR